jgi:putative Mn2+ efflux pump MntP
MDFLAILLIAVALAMDAFAVSVAAGVTLKNLSFRPTFRLSFHFGLFQFLMPIVGWLAGRSVADYIAAYDHWIAFGLLAAIGGRMIRSAWQGGEKVYTTDPTRGITLAVLSVAVSIDALAVGLSLALLHIAILYPSVIFGVVTAALSVVGALLGCRLGRIGGRQVEFLGGVILIAIGFRILMTHLMQ